MHLAELIHQSQGSASEFQQGGGLFRQAFHHLVLRIGERFGYPINHAKRSNAVVDVGFEGEACIEPDVGFFLDKGVVAEFLVKQCVFHHKRFGIEDRMGTEGDIPVGFAGLKAHL